MPMQTRVNLKDLVLCNVRKAFFVDTTETQEVPFIIFQSQVYFILCRKTQ